jgi:hypothetical protein
MLSSRSASMAGVQGGGGRAWRTRDERLVAGQLHPPESKIAAAAVMGPATACECHNCRLESAARACHTAYCRLAVGHASERTDTRLARAGARAAPLAAVRASDGLTCVCSRVVASIRHASLHGHAWRDARSRSGRVAEGEKHFSFDMPQQPPRAQGAPPSDVDAKTDNQNQCTPDIP